MMNLQKLNVEELSIKESKSIDGGLFPWLYLGIVVVSGLIGALIYKLTKD